MALKIKAAGASARLAKIAKAQGAFAIAQRNLDLSSDGGGGPRPVLAEAGVAKAREA
jgi:hypothetical protein